jgi:hypothetical protein
VADAVNRRPDSYTGRAANRGLFGRTTRGFNRAARGIGDATRDITDGVGNRFTRTNNRTNTFARPHGRIGTTFRNGENRNHARVMDSNNRVGNYEMNRTERGIPRSGVNRATRRAQNRNVNRSAHLRTRTDGVALANNADETVAVFFNKQKAEPVQPQNAVPSTYDDTYYHNHQNGYYHNSYENNGHNTDDQNNANTYDQNTYDQNSQYYNQTPTRRLMK